VITVPAQVPEVIVPILLRLDAVVNEANEVTSVGTNVLVPDGKVTFVVAVVVRVRLNAPEVIKEEPSAKVKVADDAGAVIATLLYVEADAFPFAKITPDIDDEKPVPVNKEPAIPAPPDTLKAPVVAFVAAVVSVTATPDIETIPVEGLTTNEVIVDSPRPEEFEVFTVVIKKD
jgi:hypothetical protein